MSIIGFIFICLGLILGIMSKILPKTRLLFGDFSVLTQYIVGFILVLIGIGFLYLGGQFN